MRPRSRSVGYDEEKDAVMMGPDPYAPIKPKTLRQIPVGYSRLAAFINLSEDLAVFRRYGNLRARSLLYRQAELYKKEKELERLDDREADRFGRQNSGLSSPGDIGGINSRRRHRSSSGSNPPPPGPPPPMADSGVLQNRQWLNDTTERRELMTDIREMLKDYDDEVLRYREMLAIPKAQSWQIKYVRRWMKSKPLVSLESHFLDDEDDVIALRKTPEDVVELADWLSDFLHRAGKVFNPIFKGRAPAAVRDENGIAILSKSKKHYVWRLFFAIIAAGVLLVGVIALYLVNNPASRLGILCGATAACSIIIATMTSAKKSEVFGASAAYCAVLVVFVGTTLNNKDGN